MEKFSESNCQTQKRRKQGWSQNLGNSEFFYINAHHVMLIKLKYIYTLVCKTIHATTDRISPLGSRFCGWQWWIMVAEDDVYSTLSFCYAINRSLLVFSSVCFELLFKVLVLLLHMQIYCCCCWVSLFSCKTCSIIRSRIASQVEVESASKSQLDHCCSLGFQPPGLWETCIFLPYACTVFNKEDIGSLCSMDRLEKVTEKKTLNRTQHSDPAATV